MTSRSPTSADTPSLLQVLSRQIGHGRLIYLVLAECRLILSEAKAPQPDNDVHDGRAHNRGWHIMVRLHECVQEAKAPHFIRSVALSR
jgi:hypothetical protein